MKTIISTVSFSICFLMVNYWSYQHISHNEEESNKIPKTIKPVIENKLLIEWVSKKIDSVKLANNIPAISVGVIYKSRVLMTKGFGHYQRNGVSRVDAGSIYQIASDTKKMTGIIARNLEAEGILDIDRPIVNYLNNFLNDEAIARLQNITMKNLLEHQSGLPYRQLTINRKDGEPFLIPYTEQELQQDLNKVKLKSAPGSKFGYSNFGYAVAGYILELASGKSYPKLIDEYIATPYLMANTTATLTKTQKNNLVTPYFKDNRNRETYPALMGKLTAAGGVYSNILDLITLMKNQIDGYKNLDLENSLVLHSNPSSLEDSYGFGLGKKVFEKGTQYGHGGDLDGYASAYVFSPEFESGVIILTSSGGKWVGELEKELFYKLTNRKYEAPKNP